MVEQKQTNAKRIQWKPSKWYFNKPHSLFSVRTNRVNQPRSHIAEVLTHDADVTQGLSEKERKTEFQGTVQ